MNMAFSLNWISFSAFRQTTSPSAALKSDTVFAEIGKHVAADATLYKKVNGIIAYKITSGGSLAKTWSKFDS